MKKTIIITSVICVAVIIAAVVLGLAGGSGNSRVENTTAGTSQSTAATLISLPPAPKPPEPTDESYFNFKYRSVKNMQTGKDEGWYIVSAKSIDNLPEVLVIPDEYNGLDVRWVEVYGFKGAKIKKLFLGKNIEVVDVDAFSGCTELEEVISYEKAGIGLGSSCFEGCTSLKSVIFYGGDIVLDANIFKDCTSLESVMLGENCNLEHIKNGTFHGCESLKTLALPNTVSSIARDAFIGCNDVNIIMKSNENIENRGNCLIQKSDKSLLWCRSADDIPTDGSVTHVENFYFLERDGVTEYVMPDAIESIGEGAFEKCKSLKSIVLSKNLKEIPENAFTMLENLKKVTAYEISSIGTQAFTGCTSLSEITMTGSVEVFQSFEGCVKLTKIPFEGEARRFHNALNECTGLTDVTLRKGVWLISISFNNCPNVKSISLPEKTERINSSFYGCNRVSEIVIPDGVQEISGSFNNCTGLEKVTLPKSITSLRNSFTECIRLRDIYYGGTMEDWENADIDIVGQLTVHCTDGDIKLYIE